MEDLTEQANEIQEVMGRSYGMPEIDDDELEVILLLILTPLATIQPPETPLMM